MVRQKLIDLRTAKRYNVKQFAEAIGTTRQYVWAIEHGKVKPGLKAMQSIADTLGLKITTVLNIFEEKGEK